MKSPTLEAEHAIDDATALSLYDCLVPQIKELRRFKVTKDSEFSVADFRSQLKIKQLDYDLEMKRLPQARVEIKTLTDQLEQFKDEQKIVQWYCETMEQGIDTKKLVGEYAKLRKEYDFLSDHSSKSCNKLEKELSSCRGKLDEALEQLKKQQETVVKPLVDECVKREKQNVKVEAALQDRQCNLKILYAMIRSPKLCDMMYKAERKRFEKE